MIFPPKLKKGDQIAIISPSFSLENDRISDGIKELANKRLGDLGLKLYFEKHVNEIDFFMSSSIQSRVEDIHSAFENKNIKMIINAIGGYNSNQLLPYLNFDIIKKNPKIFCGYSDINVLQNAILAKTGLVTYYGPYYFNFGEKKGFNYTEEYFNKALFTDDPYDIIKSDFWSDDKWIKDQENRNFYPHEGYRTINKGEIKGTLWGGNLGSLRLLQGTEYFPKIDGGILFVEECMPCNIGEFDRQLESLLQCIDWNISGLIIGKFEQKSDINREKITNMIKNKIKLNNIPVVSNVNIGHVYPFATVPIGGNIYLNISDTENIIKVLQE